MMAWFFAFFFVSGFCSLVYQVIWLRLAMAAFGVTTPFVSIVLSVFMAGLALGSWGVGRLGRRLERAAIALAALRARRDRHWSLCPDHSLRACVGAEHPRGRE